MEAPKESNHPLDPSLFSSLPEDIVLSILARVSRSYYPKLCLVSKSFRSLILSKELNIARSELETREDCVYVCLQPPTHPCDRLWFSLWIKPDDHQTLKPHSKIQGKSTGNLLVQMPSSYTPCLPRSLEAVGSETYVIGGLNSPSSNVMVYNDLVSNHWRKAPNMKVARKNAFTCSLDGKIYVMGGCEKYERKYWGEVFDTKTQTWEPLPDPGTQLRFSTIKKVESLLGEVFVRTIDKKFVYLRNHSRWEVEKANLGESICQMENILYAYNDKTCWWHDKKRKEWRRIRGLSGLDQYGITKPELGNYDGKLVIVWIGPATYPEVWCAVISLEKRKDGEVWGQIEWADVVLTVPWSYKLMRCTNQQYVFL